MKPEKSFEKVILDFEVGFEDFLPKRLEILAEGFAKRWDSQQVNEKLLENDCEILYVRSYFEASLIYAFDHGIDYPQWKELFDKCQKIYDESNQQSEIFSGGKITLKQLEEYVFKGSDNSLQTEYLTRWMETELKEKGDIAGFQTFMTENANNFSA